MSTSLMTTPLSGDIVSEVLFSKASARIERADLILQFPRKETTARKEKKDSSSACTSILEGSYSPAELSSSETTQIDYPWYDAYVARHNKDVNMQQLDEAFQRYSVEDLRHKMLAIQEQLLTYYDLLEKYEECKAANSQLKEENKQLKSTQKKRETKYKKLVKAHKKQEKELCSKDEQMADLATELAKTKIHLAHAKTIEDHQYHHHSNDNGLLDEEEKSYCNSVYSGKTSASAAVPPASNTAISIMNNQSERKITSRRASWFSLGGGRRNSAISISNETSTTVASLEDDSSATDHHRNFIAPESPSLSKGNRRSSALVIEIPKCMIQGLQCETLAPFSKLDNYLEDYSTNDAEDERQEQFLSTTTNQVKRRKGTTWQQKMFPIAV